MNPTIKKTIKIIIGIVVSILLILGIIGYFNLADKHENLKIDLNDIITDIEEEIENINEEHNNKLNELDNKFKSLDNLTNEHDKNMKEIKQKQEEINTQKEIQKESSTKPISQLTEPNQNPDIKLANLEKCPGFDKLIGFKAEREVADRFLKFLNNMEDFQGIGAVDTPTGILLYGVAGTGKTTFAQALAKAANLPFFDISSSMFSKGIIGEAPKLVRDLFETARFEAQNNGKGAIIFIDECEEVFKDLAGDTSNFNKDTVHVVNEFKAQMTSKENDPLKPVLVIGATNHLNKIDEAIKSRFSYVIEIKPGNLEERKQMLEFLIKQRKNPYSDEARNYLLNVVNKALEYLPDYKRANRILTSLLKETATTFAMNRKQTTPKRDKISIEDVKEAFKLRVHPDTTLLDKVEADLKPKLQEEKIETKIENDDKKN